MINCRLPKTADPSDKSVLSKTRLNLRAETGWEAVNTAQCSKRTAVCCIVAT